MRKNGIRIMRLPHQNLDFDQAGENNKNTCGDGLVVRVKARIFSQPNLRQIGEICGVCKRQFDLQRKDKAS